jgi:hypothetical protein
MLLSFDFEQIISEPTFSVKQSHNKSIIDLALVANNKSVEKFEIVDNLLETCDHRGKSEIPNFVFKKCIDSISKFLFVLYSEAIEKSYISDKLKINVITPIPKNDKEKSFSIPIEQCLSVKMSIKFLNK